MTELIDKFFWLCVWVLQVIGDVTGWGYNLANIIIFVIVQPGLILLFFVLWRLEKRKNKLSTNSDIISTDVFGIDFTSTPKRGKPLTCVHCEFTGTNLRFVKLATWLDWPEFENFLSRPGPWIAGIDFPFGQSRKLVQNVGWPTNWADYVRVVSKMEKTEFEDILEEYKKYREIGDKEHSRKTDDAANSISPQKLHGIPVGKMFFQGAKRLLSSGVLIPKVFEGDPSRIVVEAYPGVLAKRLGASSYKNDAKKKQTNKQEKTRRILLKDIMEGDQFIEEYGFTVEAPYYLCDDPTGDQLDALLCAIQAAWAFSKKDVNYGAPSNLDSIEGWIADPVTCKKMEQSK